MKLSSILYIFALIGILSLLIYFARGVFIYAVRFWYITIPILIYIMFRSNRQQVKEDKNDKIEDADFEIIEEDEEEKK